MSFLVTKEAPDFVAAAATAENAIEALKTAKGKVYKLAGEIMIETNKADLEKELAAKAKKLDLRVKAIDKQEKSIYEKAMELQNELAKELK